MENNVLLADIGNSFVHIYNDNEVVDMAHNDAIKKYAQKPLNYISVNQLLEEKISKHTDWKNISSLIALDGAYDTMGVDRRALCLSHSDGVFVDAGSAITVDVMENGIYQGGSYCRGSVQLLRHMPIYLRCWMLISIGKFRSTGFRLQQKMG